MFGQYSLELLRFPFIRLAICGGWVGG